jgi:uncharacterized protein YegP (UPF0339 family)
MKLYIDMIRDENGQWHAVLKGRNGRKRFVTEQYKSKKSVQDAVNWLAGMLNGEVHPVVRTIDNYKK